MGAGCAPNRYESALVQWICRHVVPLHEILCGSRVQSNGGLTLMRRWIPSLLAKPASTRFRDQSARKPVIHPFAPARFLLTAGIATRIAQAKLLTTI